eukprot:TRINITY_DN2895_c0_g1_i1.p1 TRINITY_DN2895_c0_g1~~TRINITY_DN2895_c0_g1_i1.p1  ORF type:complete len:244 (-),score=83.73 TRINITY_DN2895_c0_g1_i1:152-850(-)
MAEEGSQLTNEKSFSAVVIGGTGAIGKSLVQQLIASPTVSKVTIFNRRKVDLPNHDGKVTEVLVDFDKLEDYKEQVANHDVGYCCLGTTIADAGSDEAFRKVDFGYVTKFAELSKQNGVKRFHLVSSQGADASSWFLYLRTKGEADDKVASLGFDSTGIYRPGFLDRGDQARFKEKFIALFASTISVETVAHAIFLQSKKEVQEDQKSAPAFYDNKSINDIVGSKTHCFLKK